MRAKLNRLGEAVCVILFIMALAGCGSGGHVAGTAEGAYAGTLGGNTSSTDFQLIVLESGEFADDDGTVDNDGVNYLEYEEVEVTYNGECVTNEKRARKQ